VARRSLVVARRKNTCNISETSERWDRKQTAIGTRICSHIWGTTNLNTAWRRSPLTKETGRKSARPRIPDPAFQSPLQHPAYKLSKTPLRFPRNGRFLLHGQVAGAVASVVYTIVPPWDDNPTPGLPYSRSCIRSAGGSRLDKCWWLRVKVEALHQELPAPPAHVARWVSTTAIHFPWHHAASHPTPHDSMPA